MLKLIEGGFYSDAHDKVVAELRAAIERGERAFLIVPEQQTVSIESEIIDTLTTASALKLEVTNFTRFANTVFRSVGGIAKESASAAKRALIMWRAITESRPLLHNPAKDVTPGTVSKMLTAVKQMSSCSVSAEALQAAADALKLKSPDDGGRLVAKMEDIAIIMIAYKRLLGAHFSDGDEDIENAARKLSSSPDFLSGTRIFIDGFASFTEPQYKLIGTMLGITDITVTLTLPKAEADAFEYTEIKEAHSRLVKLAAKAGAQVSLKHSDPLAKAPNLFAKDLLSLLFRSTGLAHKDLLSDADFISLIEAESPYEECDFVAADIKKRVMGGGKYSDFGIIARSLDAYDGILGVSFDKAKIPLFTSTRTDVESFEVVKLIYSAFSAVGADFSRHDVISYAKCSLSGAPRELVDELELYAERWQISGSRFTDGVFWNMNPDGFTDRRSKYHDEKLERIDRARSAIIDPLTALAADVANAKTVEDYSGALYSFLRSLSVEEQLIEKSRTDAASADLPRVYKLICNSLDSICDILAGTECSMTTFLSLLKIAFAESNIGRIPTYAEQVTAGNADMVRLSGKKHIYIIGANYGSLPARIDDDSYFTDKDKRIISSLGLSVSQDTDIRSSRELYYILRAISYARCGVTVSYSALDTALKPTPPSDIIKRITEISHGVVRPLRLASLSSAERVYTAEYALEHIASSDPDSAAIREALIKSGSGDRLKVSDGQIRNVGLRLEERSVNSLYGKVIPMTQSRIDDFISCPMGYFCKHSLSLSDNRPAEFGANNIGTFIHGILEEFFGELKKRGTAVADLTDEERNKLIEKIATEYAGRFYENLHGTSARIKHTVGKLCRAARPIIDGLCEEFADCKYEPTFFELRIDKNEDGNPSPAVFKTDSGKELYIYGTMDRLDTYRKDGDVYVRVIDYKTGNKVFDVKDIEKGENLQMFLYLKSVVETDSESFRKNLGVGEGGRMIPAGVIYVKTSIADVSVEHNDPSAALGLVKANQARLGMILNDPDSIEAMNPKYIPVRFKEPGVPDRWTADKLYSIEDWKEMNKKIEAALSEITGRLTDGDIDATPLKKGGKSSACKWCSFKPFCRNANL